MGRAKDVEFKKKFSNKSKREIYDEVIRQRTRYAGMKSAYNRLEKKEEKNKQRYLNLTKLMMDQSYKIMQRELKHMRKHSIMDGLFYGTMLGGFLTVAVIFTLHTLGV